jgi:hypothetical protein
MGEESEEGGMKRFAIHVGNNLFPGVPGNDLKGCIGDAHHMRATLERRWGAAAQTVLIENSTRQQFGAAMDAAANAATRGDVDFITITISTHGILYGTGTPDNFLQALVFTDFNGKTGDGLLADVAFKAYLDRIPRTCTVEIWLDACHSATATRSLALARRRRSIVNPAFDPAKHRVAASAIKARTVRTELDNIAIWSACRDDETSADMWNEPLKEGFGAFTEAWCDAFDSAPAGTTRRALMARTIVNLLFFKAEQHPQISFQTSGA